MWEISVCSWTTTWTVSLGRQTRQHQCVKEMTSVTLKRPKWKEAGGTDNILWMSLLISHHKWMRPVILDGEEFRSCFSAPPVSLGRPNLSQSQQPSQRESRSTRATFQRLPLPNKFLRVTHSEREHCDSTKLLLLLWKRGKRKWECMCPSGLPHHLPKSFPAWLRLAVTDHRLAHRERNVAFKCSS